MKKIRIVFSLFILAGLLSLNSLATAVAAPAGSLSPAYDFTPTPTPTGTPTPPGGGSVVTNISQIFHHLVFPAETISEALTGIFDKAAEKETRQMSEEVARWTGVMGEIIQAPSQGDYSRVAQSSLPVAAALAPALFLLRLALYHWGRLLGDDDTGLRVVGDWVTAGVLAIAAGPFLDLVIRLGWWMVGKVVGETGLLAMEFVKSTTATSLVLGLANLTFLGGLLSIGLSLGSLVAVAGLLFAFAASNAVLFILAVLAPPVAIASVLSQARWLRSLWIKAVLLIALLPIVAGGVFKAGLSASSMFDQQGLLSAVIRLIWLWGATGLLISLAGILSKMTLTASVEAFGGMVKAAKQIISIGALAASGIGAAAGAGAGVGAAGAGTAGAGATGIGSTPPDMGSPGGGALSGGAAAMSHLNAAQDFNQRSATFDALGLKAPAAYNRAQAHSHELAARQAELGERMQRFGGIQDFGSPDFGFSSSANEAIGSTFQGSPQEFQKGFSGLSQHISQHGLDPNVLAAQYPEDTSRMVQAYLDHGDEINSAQNPLQSAMTLGNTEQVQDVITFRPHNNREGEQGA